MRNLRKLTAVVIAIALVLTSMTAAFAATGATPVNGDKAIVLNELGLYAGISTSTFDPDLESNLTREQATMLLLKLFGLEDEAAALTAAEVTTALTGRTDAAKVSDWAKKAVAYALANNIMSGKSTTTVNPSDKITGAEFATLIVKTMGYDVADWTKAVTQLSEIKGSDVADEYATENLTRDAAVAYMFGALTAENKDAKTLISVIVGTDAAKLAIAQEAGLVAATPAKLEVKNVAANNLRTMKIDFTKAIDSATVTSSTVKVTEAGTSVVADLKVTDDKMSVVVIYTGAVAQSDSLAVTVDGVKTADASAVTAYSATKVVTDTAIPEFTGATAVNAKQIELYFSEPINFTKTSYQVLNNIKVDGIAVIAKATPNDVKNSVVLDFPTAIAAGAHTISVADMSDYAQYKALAKDYSFTIVEDKAAPVLVSATAINTSTIEVTFDENLDATGTFTVNGKTASIASGSGKVWKLNGFGSLDLSSIVEVKVAYVGQKDVVGNTVSTAVTYTFKVADDTALPTVTAGIETGNKITLTFSKAMNTGAGTITVKDKDGNTIKTIAVTAGIFKTDSNNKVIVLQGSDAGLASFDAAKVTVNITGMKDDTIRANLLPDATLTLAALDTKAPTVSASYFVTAGTTAADDTVTFYFSEAMDEATLKNLSNYVGSSYKSLSTVADASVVSVAADAKSITIKLNGISAKPLETFTVYAIKDVAGNMMTLGTVSKLVSTALHATAAESSDGLKVKVTFDTKVSSIDPSAFKVQKIAVGNPDYAVFVNVELASDGLSATFTSSKSLGTNPSDYKVVDLNTSLVKNIYNSTLTTGSALTITDKVKPTVSVATGTTTAGSIVITFTEAVSVANTATLAADLLVKDKDGNLVDITTTGAITYLDADGNAASAASFSKIVFTGNTAENYTFQLFGRNVKDIANNNIVTELAATTVKSK